MTFPMPISGVLPRGQFPIIEGVFTDTSNSTSASVDFDLPAGIQAGELLLVEACIHSTINTGHLVTPSGWKLEHQDFTGDSGRLAIFSRIATGSETTIAIARDGFSTAASRGVIARRISRAEYPLFGKAARGSSTAPNSPIFNSLIGNRPFLIIPAFGGGSGSSSSTSVSSGPSGYLDLRQAATGSSSSSNRNIVMGSAHRPLKTASENPAAFTLAASRAWGAITCAVAPLGSPARPVEIADNRLARLSSHSSVNFGPEHASRRIFVLAIHGNTSSDPGTSPTATIGGESATLIRAVTTGTGTGSAVGVALFAANPSGTSGTVSVSWSGEDVSILALRVMGFATTASDHIPLGTTSGPSGDIDIPTGGLLLGFTARSANDEISWSGITDQVPNMVTEGSPSNNTMKRLALAWDFDMDAESGRTVSYSPHTSTQGSNSGLAASFAPL